MADLVAAIGDVDDQRRGIRNRPKLKRQSWVLSIEEPRRRVCFGGDDHGIGFERRAVEQLNQPGRDRLIAG